MNDKPKKNEDDDEFVFPTIPLLVISPIVATWYLRRRIRRNRENRRRDGTQALANELGLRFSAKPTSAEVADVAARIGQLGPLIEMGSRWVEGSRDRWLDDLATGTRAGVTWTIVQHGCSVRSGQPGEETTSVYVHGVVAATVAFDVPAASWKPANVLDRVAAAVGFHDVELGVQAFDDRFRVRSNEPDRLKATLRPDVIQYLLTLPPRAWHLGHGHVLVASGDGGFEPEVTRAVVREIEGFLAVLGGHAAR